jgi:3-isopropylmalate dehydrogenase
MDILVLPGDDIGPEITAATLTVLRALEQRFGLKLDLHEEPVGLATIATKGIALPDEVKAMTREADGVVLGPLSTYDYPPGSDEGTSPSGWIRKELDLYANMRPSYTRAGVPSVIDRMDLVIARENREDFYADRSMAVGSGEFMPTEDLALCVGMITAQGSRRIAQAAFDLARRRRKKVTVVHKANALKIYNGLFLREVEKVAAENPDIEFDEVIVDAMTALLVRTPERFDVVVTTNLFGDILSDEAAELSGGLGLAASLNHGDRYAVAQAGHGSAPDISGQDVANPVSLIQSAAMLLDHLGAKDNSNDLIAAAKCLNESVDALLLDANTRTRDLGGTLGTQAFGKAVADKVLAD